MSKEHRFRKADDRPTRHVPIISFRGRSRALFGKQALRGVNYSLVFLLFVFAFVLSWNLVCGWVGFGLPACYLFFRADYDAFNFICKQALPVRWLQIFLTDYCFYLL